MPFAEQSAIERFGSVALANLHSAIEPEGMFATEARLGELYARLTQVESVEGVAALGIQGLDLARCALFVTAPGKPLGKCRMRCFGTDNLLIIDNSAFSGHFDVSLRFGTAGVVLFAGGSPDILVLDDVLLRNADQWLFWGAGSTSVGSKIEIEGDGLGLSVGDDCMFSSSTFIRNYDMHTLVGLEDWQPVNPAPRSVIVEQHVWLGDGALLVNPGRLGYGSVVGARAFVNGEVPETSVVAGTPARVLRSGSSWDRQVRGVSDQTKDRLERLAAARASAT